MSKPTIHAASSAKQYGGKAEDYLKIHDWFDQTKGHLGDNRHRAILHSSFGIFLCEQVFGHTITNSDGREVSVRAIGEQHCIEDLGFIPSVADYLCEMTCRDWMCGVRADKPESRKKLGKQTKADADPDDTNIEKSRKTIKEIRELFDGIRNPKAPVHRPLAPYDYTKPTYVPDPIYPIPYEQQLQIRD